MIVILDRSNVGFLAFREHLMCEVPSGSPGKLRNDNIAITKKIDIKVNVVNRLDKQLVLLLKQGRGEERLTSREMKI